MIPATIKQNRVFILLSLLWVIGLSIACAVVDKGDLHLWLNSYHTPEWDLFFRYYTYVGDWVPYVVVFVLLLYRFGWSAFMAADIAVTALIAHPIKRLACTLRPILWFQDNYPDVQLPLVDGVHMLRYLSFPSGHTVLFFLLFFVLSAIVCERLNERPNKYTHILCACVGTCAFILAALGAYSRIYLSQHFAQDILGGTIISLVVSLALCYAIPYFQKQSWWNRKIGKRV